MELDQATRIFVSVRLACSGLIKTGQAYFNSALIDPLDNVL